MHNRTCSYILRRGPSDRKYFNKKRKFENCVHFLENRRPQLLQQHPCLLAPAPVLVPIHSCLLSFPFSSTLFASAAIAAAQSTPASHPSSVSLYLLVPPTACIFIVCTSAEGGGSGVSSRDAEWAPPSPLHAIVYAR